MLYARYSSPNHTRRSRGQSLVELALITPMLLLIVLLAVDIGRAFSAYVQVGNMAREGASFGSEFPNDTAGIQSAAIGEGDEIYGVTPTVQSTIGDDSIQRPNSADEYQFIRVTVTYQFEPIVAFPPIPDSMTLQRSAEMRVVGSP